MTIKDWIQTYARELEDSDAERELEDIVTELQRGWGRAMNKTETFELAIVLFNNLPKWKQCRVAKAIKSNGWDYTYEWESCIKQAIIQRKAYNQLLKEYGVE